MKKEDFPEWLCFGACFFFLGVTIIQPLIGIHFSYVNFFMPFGFGLFMFLLSLIMNLQARVERLEKKTLKEEANK